MANNDVARAPEAANPEAPQAEAEAPTGVNPALIAWKVKQRMARRREASEAAPAGLGAEATARLFVAAGVRDLNKITDETFYALHPEQRGKKLESGSPDAAEWIRIRDEVAKPALASAPPTPQQAAADAVAHAHDAHAPDEAHAPPPGQAAHGEHAGAPRYYTQNDNTYDDDAAGAQWDRAGGAVQGTCNMTSLAMALVSLCDGDEAKVRAAAIAALKKMPMRAGAYVKVGGRSVGLAKVLADPGLADEVQLPDLLIAITLEKWGAGGILVLTSAGNIGSVAELLGLGHKTKGAGGALTSAKTRAMAKEKLARGEKMIVSSPYHYLFLVDVREDGIVVHDPCGLRLSPSIPAPHFMFSGSIARFAGRWLGEMENSAFQKVALRRASTNPEVSAMVSRLIAITTMSGKARTDELNALKKESGRLEMGACNFYGHEDYADWGLEIMVDLAPGAAEGKAGA